MNLWGAVPFMVILVGSALAADTDTLRVSVTVEPSNTNCTVDLSKGHPVTDVLAEAVGPDCSHIEIKNE